MENKAHVFVRLRKSEEVNDRVWEVRDNTLYQQTSAVEQVSYFGFDEIFSQKNNVEIYQKNLRDIVLSSLGGSNCTIFAYGQTGSGKTHTMLGNEHDPGIIKLAIRDIFRSGVEEIRVSYIELYNERIYDLVDPERSVRLFNVSQKPKLANASEVSVGSEAQVFKLLEHCEGNRKTGSTEFNTRSSRSHTIFIAKVKKREFQSVLCLIDLAGSEKATGAYKRRLEGSFINRSLLALGKVVNSMSKSGFVGFRDSKLTRILQPYMDGSSKLVALCTISPSKRCAEESISTLNFAARLGKVKLEPKNERIEPKDPNTQSLLFFCESCRCVLEKQKHIEAYKDRGRQLIEKMGVNSSIDGCSSFAIRPEAHADKSTRYTKSSKSVNGNQGDIENANESILCHTEKYAPKNTYSCDFPCSKSENSSMEHSEAYLPRDNPWTQSFSFLYQNHNPVSTQKPRYSKDLLRLEEKKRRYLIDLESRGGTLSEMLKKLRASEEYTFLESGLKNTLDNGLKQKNVSFCDRYSIRRGMLNTGVENGMQDEKDIEKDGTWELIYAYERNRLLMEKIRLYQQRIDVLEESLASFYSECPSKNDGNAFLLEKNLFKLKCKLLEKEFVYRMHKHP